MMQQKERDAEQQRTTTLREFDNLDFYKFLNICSDRYNENTPVRSPDPVDSWKSDTIRPLTRNKVRDMAAQATATILYPFVEAHNDDDMEDKALAIVMADIVEDILEKDDYTEKIIDIAIDLLTKPLAIVKQGFYEHMKTVKELKEDGSYKKKEVLDHIYSGFRLYIIPTENLYLGNIYEPNLQKQPYVIEHNLITYSSAKAKYGNLPAFKYVTTGMRAFCDFENRTFFNQEIKGMDPQMVEEVIFMDVQNDLELTAIGGVLIHEDPERPIQQNRDDKLYPYAVNGFERFHNKFAYYRPLVWNLKNIQDELDIMHRMTIDGTFLRLMPPLAVYGEESMDNTVIVPGNLIPLEDPDSKITPIQSGFDIGAGWSAVSAFEQNAAATSTSDQSGGNPLSKEATKFEISTLEQNAATKLGLFGKRLSFMVRDIGRLIVPSVLEHMPFAEVLEVTGSENKVKLHSVVIKNREVDGQPVSRTIKFRPDTEMTPEALAGEESELLKQELDGSREANKDRIPLTKSIMIVNRKLFKRAKYLVKISPRYDDKSIRDAKGVQFYDRATVNPVGDQKKLLGMLQKTLVPDLDGEFSIDPEPETGAVLPGQNGQAKQHLSSEFEF